jgi:hypothetical protein
MQSVRQIPPALRAWPAYSEQAPRLAGAVGRASAKHRWIAEIEAKYPFLIAVHPAAFPLTIGFEKLQGAIAKVALEKAVAARYPVSRLRFTVCPCYYGASRRWSSPMQSGMKVTARVATLFALVAFASPAWATAVVFDSLDDVTAGSAYAGGIDPVMSGTFNTGATPVRVDVTLLLRDSFPQDGAAGDTYTVSLDGGIPLSDLSFDPMSGLNYVNGSSVDFQGPVIQSVTLPVASLPAVWTDERYDQFDDIVLIPKAPLSDS